MEENDLLSSNDKNAKCNEDQNIVVLKETMDHQGGNQQLQEQKRQHSVVDATSTASVGEKEEEEEEARPPCGEEHLHQEVATCIAFTATPLQPPHVEQEDHSSLRHQEYTAPHERLEDSDEKMKPQWLSEELIASSDDVHLMWRAKQEQEEQERREALRKVARTTAMNLEDMTTILPDATSTTGFDAEGESCSTPMMMQTTAVPEPMVSVPSSSSTIGLPPPTAEGEEPAAAAAAPQGQPPATAEAEAEAAAAAAAAADVENEEDEDQETRRLLQPCVIRVDGPMENLPTLMVPEYASLGRCVVLEKCITGIRRDENNTDASNTTTAVTSSSSSAATPATENNASNTNDTNNGENPTSFIYMGVVSLVTADCLTLLQCRRFTVEDFERRVPSSLLVDDEHRRDRPQRQGQQHRARGTSVSENPQTTVTTTSTNSNSNNNNNSSSSSNVSNGQASHHVVEQGLTHPETRVTRQDDVARPSQEEEGEEVVDVDEEDPFALLDAYTNKESHPRATASLTSGHQSEGTGEVYRDGTTTTTANTAGLSSTTSGNFGVHPVHPLLEEAENMQRECLSTACSMGPMPYVTFQRNSIHNVRYVRRTPLHRCFGGSLFSHPENKRHDMQWLRMFVRQYLVGTSQGRNRRGISLKRFICWAGNCSAEKVNDAELEQIAREQLELLVRLHNKIERSRVLLHHRSGADPLEILDRSVVLRLLLLQTGVPKLSFVVATIECCVAVFILTFGFVAYFFSLSHLVVSFLQANWQFVFGGAFVGFAAAGLTAYHAGTMCPPLASQVYMLALRVFVALCATAYSILTGIAFTSFLTGNSMDNWAQSGNVELTDSLRSALRRLCLPLAISNFFLVCVLVMDMVIVGFTVWVLRKMDRTMERSRNRVRVRIRLV